MSAVAVPVLEIGGTHVTAALVDAQRFALVGAPVREAVESTAAAETILAAFARAAAGLDPAPGVTWAVAMPDPFDYAAGVGRFRGVGKYEALDGVDVAAELLARVPRRPGRLIFVNDADAFTLGEAHGAAARVAGLTLGTGVGSGWVVNGVALDAGPGVPDGGRIHTVHVGGVPLEDVMSRRAIRRAYARATGDADADVRDIAGRARAGDAPAVDVLATALRTLGHALGDRLRDFGAEQLVVGGSMSASWDLFAPWFGEGAGPLPATRVSADTELAALCGAAWFSRPR